MKILFDENMPRPLRRHLVGHHIFTVQDMGWAGVKNGNLLTLAEGQNFDVLLTFDRNLEYQQNMTGRKIAIIVIVAPDKRMAALLPLIPNLLFALSDIQPGTIYRLEKQPLPPEQPSSDVTPE